MKLFLTVFFVLALSSLAVAQGKNRISVKVPNFAGNWVFDKVKSDAGVGGDVSFPDGTLVVTQNENEIVMVSTSNMDGNQFVQKTIYSLEVGTKRDVPVDNDSRIAVGTWVGNSLVIKTVGGVAPISENISPPSGQMVEKWTLSADGKTLTQTITSGGTSKEPAMKARFVHTRTR